MSIISLLVDNLAVIGGLIMAALLGWFGIKAKRAESKAQEATKRAQKAEDERAQAEYRETHTREAVRAMEDALNKPLPVPKKDRSDFESKW